MNQTFSVGLFDELEALYPDSVGGAEQYRVAAAKGTVAGVHMLFTGLTPGLPVAVEVEGPHTAFKLFEMVPVPVEVNTGAKQRSAYLHDDVNDTLIRKAPFYIYEALKPIYNMIMPAGVSAAAAFKTPVEFVKEVSSAEWTFTITHAGEAKKLHFTVDQYPCAVPPPSEQPHEYVNWISFANIARYHGLSMDTPAYDRMLMKYLRAAVYSRQNVLCIPLEAMFAWKDGEPVLQAQKLTKLIGMAEKAGIRLFEGSAFCGRSEGLADDDDFFRSLDLDKMESPDEIAQAFREVAFDKFDNGTGARVSLTGELLPGEAGEKTLRKMATALYAYLSAHDLVDRWNQCLLDEPNDALAPVYHLMSSIVKPCMPGVKILEPVLPTHAVKGALDIWCPSADVYENDRAFYDEQVKNGDELYVYTCLTPGGNYMNRMLDMQRIRQTLLFWVPAIYPNVKGFLHWGLNQYLDDGDPFARSCVMFSERVLEFHPKRAMFLPAGDFCILYPGYNEPWITTRSEAHRLGMEDLCLLKKLPQAEAEQIARKLVQGYGSYDKSIENYRKVKRELLEKSL